MLSISDIQDPLYRTIVSLGEQSHDGDATLSLNREGNVGLSAAGLQFTQSSGNLGAVLARAASAFPTQFAAAFGPSWRELLSVTASGSLAPVGGVQLWREPWVSRFKAVGRTTWWSSACRGYAFSNKAGFWPAALYVAKALNLTTERSLCIVMDRAVNGGPGRARSSADKAAAYPDVWTLDEAGRVGVFGSFALAYVKGGRYEDTMQERWTRVYGAPILRDEAVNLAEGVA